MTQYSAEFKTKIVLEVLKGDKKLSRKITQILYMAIWFMWTNMILVRFLDIGKVENTVSKSYAMVGCHLILLFL